MHIKTQEDATLVDALASLRAEDDGDWTDDGAPALAAVNQLVSFSVTRKRVTDVAPDLKRDTFEAWLEALSDAAVNDGGSEDVIPMSDDQREARDLYEERDRLVSEEAELGSRRDEVERARRAKEVELNAVISQIEEIEAKRDPMADVKSHLDRQRAERYARAQMHSGPLPGEMSIDQQMAMSGRRGQPQGAHIAKE